MNQNQHIEKVIEKQSCQQIENNRLRLKVSCDAIKWLTFQTCALRGHDESSNSKNRDVLARHNLSIKNIRGQGYDGASNMRGEWSGLLALFLSECPYAYYIHCFPHRLHLALVATSREVISGHQFFSKLTLITNVVSSSSKRHDQLQAGQIVEVEKLIANHEPKTGKGLNKVGTIKRASDTRWSSHLSFVRSLVIMFEATYLVLKIIIAEGATYSQRGDADYVYNVITSFEFVFILHLMKEILEITDDLCQALQRKSQDVLNAMCLVSTTKMLIQKMRESGWDSLLESVKLFCKKHEIDIPNMNAHYNSVDVFIATIDSQLQELNVRFKEDMMESLILNSSLDPRDGFRSFRIDDVFSLANKFYSKDFSEQEKLHLRYQLEHFELDIQHDSEMQKLSTISELCQYLVKSRKSTIYPLINRLVRLVLTLLVSTATTERAFSAMSLVKTKLRNNMGHDFLANSFIIYIEKEIVDTFSIDSIIDEFYAMKERRVQLKMPRPKS
ncbi:hypothetical protein P3X46_013449 [Hevea brasiliensis]|uniref:HAT C-terminal dimerisation domain-containing protein n=1 Tax=Hevea brasiliensis TaxID=3981 RepID=A0ABQ9M7H7_HEVBR|nr:hypothetical protein P3X46_013449 [Hevea brasiliensis]